MDLRFLEEPRLLLLLLVAALALGYLVVQRQRRKYAVRFTNVSLLESVAPKRPSWRRHLAAAASLIGLALLVSAFARPTWPVQVPRERATVVLALDVSQSMAATDVKPTRIEAAQRAASRFVRRFPERFQLGLVTFSGTATVAVPPSLDRQRMLEAIRNLRLSQRTAIGDAIRASLDAIENLEQTSSTTNPSTSPSTGSGTSPSTGPSGSGGSGGAGGGPREVERKVPARIIVLSDGATNSGTPNAVAAAEAKEAGVPVSTIAFGTDDGFVEVQDQIVPVPVDRGALQEIADETGGSYAAAVSQAELERVYDDLGSSIGYKTVRRDVTTWFIGFALVFGMAGAALSLIWTSRLP
jgi:Ca-activated chloride channel family protein